MPLDQRNVDRAIAYHGPSLVDQLAREEIADINLPSFLSLPQSGSKAEPDRDANFDEQLVSFIAKKADLLFKRPSKKFSPDEDAADDDIPDLYAIVPPLEAYMEVPEELRKEHFYKTVCPGDIVIGTVTNILEAGLTLTLICFDYGKGRDIDSLKITATCSVREIPLQSRYEDVMESFKMKELIRAVVLSVGSTSDKLLLSLRKDALPQGKERLLLGCIEEQDLPVHYRRLKQLDGASYNEHTQRRLGFSNTSCVSTLSSRLSLRTDRRLSLMRGLHKASYPKEDYAIPLRKAQSHRWAFKSVAEGVAYFKKGMTTEAMQLLNKALIMDNENVEAYVARGALYANNDSYAKALEDFTKALEFNPDHQNAKSYMCETLIVYGRSLVDRGEDDEALHHFEDALKIKPDLEEAHIAIRRLQSKLDTSRQDSVVRVDDERSRSAERGLNPDVYEYASKSETEKTSDTLRRLLEEERLKKKKRKSRDSSDFLDGESARQRRHSSFEPASKVPRLQEDERHPDPRRKSYGDFRDKDDQYSAASGDRLPSENNRAQDSSRDRYERPSRSPDDRRYKEQYDKDSSEQRSGHSQERQRNRSRSRSRSPSKSEPMDSRTVATVEMRLGERIRVEQDRIEWENRRRSSELSNADYRKTSRADLYSYSGKEVAGRSEGYSNEYISTFSGVGEGQELVEDIQPPWLKPKHTEDLEPSAQQVPPKPVPSGIKFDGLETLKIRFTNNYAEKELAKRKPETGKSSSGSVKSSEKLDKGNKKSVKDRQRPKEEKSQKTSTDKRESRDHKVRSHSKEDTRGRSSDRKRDYKHRRESSSSSSSSSSSRSSSSSSSCSSRSSRSSRSSSRSSRSSSSGSGSSRERYNRARRRDSRHADRSYKHAHYKGKERYSRRSRDRGDMDNYPTRGYIGKPNPVFMSRYKIDRRKENELKAANEKSPEKKASNGKSPSNSKTGSTGDVKKPEKNGTGKEEASKRNYENAKTEGNTMVNPKESVVVKKLDPQVLRFGKWGDSPGPENKGGSAAQKRKRETLDDMENFLKQLKQTKKSTDSTDDGVPAKTNRW